MRSEIYGKILDTPASSFDGLEAHLRFLLDPEADPDEMAVIFAGLDNLRWRYELVGFGPR